MSSYTAQPPALRRVQYDPAPDSSVTVQAFFESVIVNDADPSDSITRPWESVSFALPADITEQIAALALTALTCNK